MRTFSSYYLIFDATSIATVDKIAYIKRRRVRIEARTKKKTAWKVFYQYMRKSIH